VLSFVIYLALYQAVDAIREKRAAAKEAEA
jgi:hypothetical protein